MNGLSAEERQAVIQILNEQANDGTSQALSAIIQADYDEMPVSIREFIKNPHYAGNYMQTVYPFWVEQLEELFEKGKHYSEVALTGSIGTGKAQPLSSLLLGPDGYFEMREAEVGKQVYGPDGHLHTITKIWPQGVQPVYRITFSDHTYAECEVDHLWNIRQAGVDSHGRYYKISQGQTWQTKSLRWLLNQELWLYPDRKDKQGHKARQRRFYIPVTQPVQFECRNKLPIHPYLMGMILSEGGTSDGNTSITIWEEDVQNKLKKLVDLEDCEMKSHKEYGTFSIIKKNQTSHDVCNVTRAVRDYSLDVKAIDKHIPKDYLFTSVENRIQLLQGLFDGDGSIQSGQYTYTTCSNKLYEDMKFLIESLGGVVFIPNPKDSFYKTPEGERKYTGTKTWEFYFKLPKNIIPFSSEKHRKRFGKGTAFDRTNVYRFIDKIEYVRDEECQCITMDYDEGLYLTDNCIVTHNSSIAVVAMAYELHKLMCLKNPQQYYGTNKTMFFAFFNNNLDLAKNVGFAAFQDLIRKSEWFNERGEWRGTVNCQYHPYKNIELMYGSLTSHVIGKDVFCLTGDTEIITDRGVAKLEEIVNVSVKVLTYQESNNVALAKSPYWCDYSNNEVKVVLSDYVYELIEITFSNGATLRGTPEHKILVLTDKAKLEYREFQQLKLLEQIPNPITQNVNIIEKLEHKFFSVPIPVYDVVDVKPSHNFIVKIGDSCLVSHNCAMQDEVSFCLAADTPVYTSRGSKELQDVTPLDVLYNYVDGELVASLSKGGQPTEFVDEYIQIELEDGTILKCSNNHLFMLTDGSYKRADELTEADELLEYEPYGYVYVTTNVINGRKYIGQHKGLFDNTYKGSGDVLGIAVSKYGKENFKVEVLDWAKDEDELNQKEEYWIAKFDAVKSNRYYNVCKNANPPVYKNRVCVHKDDDIKYIPSEQFDAYIQKGYIKGSGLGQSRKGVLCVKKDSEMEWIPVEKRKQYEDEGWTIPRPNDGRVIINNGVNIKYVNESDLHEYLNDGWELGNCTMHKRAGSVWMTDGDVDIIVEKDKIADYESKGFYRGRNYFKTHIYVTKNGDDIMIPSLDWKDYEARGYRRGKATSNATGTCWIKRGEDIKRVPSEELQTYLDEGWEHTNYFAGKCRIWNPELKIRKNVLPEEVDSYIEKGWEYNPQTRCEGAIAYENLKNSKN